MIIDFDIKRDNHKIKSSNANDISYMKRLKICFLILAHKNPSQLITFVNALDCKNFSFFIHINKDSNIMNHKSLEKLKNKENVFFIEERKKIAWGGYSIVEVSLLLLKEALKNNKNDYISLHSGQDLPIKNKDEIIDYLNLNHGREFIEFWKIPKVGWGAENGLERIENYWFTDKYGFDDSLKMVQKQKKLNIKRKYFRNIQPYGGSTWWTITRECGEYIIDYVNQNKTFCDYYKYTLLPDEGFFQTIILNSHFKDKVINNNLRHIEWEEWQSHPNIFREYDYNKLISSDRLFARKFDIDVDNKIIEMIAHKIAD